MTLEKLCNWMISNINDKLKKENISLLALKDIDNVIVDQKINYQFLIDNYITSNIKTLLTKEENEIILSEIENFKIFESLGILNNEFEQKEEINLRLLNIFTSLKDKLSLNMKNNNSMLQDVKKCFEDSVSNGYFINVLTIKSYIETLNMDEEEKANIMYFIAKINFEAYEKEKNNDVTVLSYDEIKENEKEEPKEIYELTKEDKGYIKKAKELFEMYAFERSIIDSVTNSYIGVPAELIPSDVLKKILLSRIFDCYEMITTLGISSTFEELNNMKKYIDRYGEFLSEEEKKIPSYADQDEEPIIEINYLLDSDNESFFDKAIKKQKLSKEQLNKITDMINKLSRGLRIKEQYNRVLGTNNGIRFFEERDVNGVKLIITYIPFNNYKNVLIISGGVKEFAISDTEKIDRINDNLIQSAIDNTSYNGGGLK